MTKAARPADHSIQTIKPYYDQTFSFPKFDITRTLKIFQIHGYYEELKIFQILAYQTLSVKHLKPRYNIFMPRRYFSTIPNQRRYHSPNNKPDHTLLYFISIGFGILLAIIGSLLYSL